MLSPVLGTKVIKGVSLCFVKIIGIFSFYIEELQSVVGITGIQFQLCISKNFYYLKNRLFFTHRKFWECVKMVGEIF